LTNQQNQPFVRDYFHAIRQEVFAAALYVVNPFEKAKERMVNGLDAS
jgi:hypothetical protein